MGNNIKDLATIALYWLPNIIVTVCGIYMAYSLWEGIDDEQD